jgi:(S)-2-hydroxyglutarate dehydrogenase
MGARRVVVVGGGAVGLAAAWRVQQRFPDDVVTVVDKEAGVARHQTGNNSGVLHCGLAYRPGTAKARLAVRGIAQMVEFCREHGVAHDVCGKLVVAAREEQVPRLEALKERGTQNGLHGLELLDLPRMREREPHVGGVRALLVPGEGIVDYEQVCETLARLIEAQGGRVALNAPVRAFHRDGAGWRVETGGGEFGADVLITCGGLQADRLARMAGERPEVSIVPFRGDYYKLRPGREHLVKHLIYPVADPRFPFLGVHFTRMIRGGIECGPNAVLAFKREGYGRTDFSLRDAADALSFPGLWRFVGRHARMCAHELRRAFSRRLFCDALQTLVPEVRDEDIEPAGAGVRAQAMRPDGYLVEDFEVIQRANAIHVLNAPSPAATACLAIGEEIAARLDQ